MVMFHYFYATSFSQKQIFCIGCNTVFHCLGIPEEKKKPTNTYFNTSSLLDMDTIEENGFSNSIKANGFLKVKISKNLGFLKIAFLKNRKMSNIKELLNKLLHIKLSPPTIMYLLKILNGIEKSQHILVNE